MNSERKGIRKYSEIKILMGVIINMLKDKLDIRIYKDRAEMGQAAAAAAAEKIISLIHSKGEINMVFAAAPSQNEFLDSLISNTDICWSKINAFHLDEYIGLETEAPQGFGNFLREKLFGKVNFKSVNYLNGSITADRNIISQISETIEASQMMECLATEECDRYSKLLKQYPLDIACIGIGENGHLAFNDPPVADFKDKSLVKVVKLDEVCRRQQVNDGCFEALELVPTHALTLTIPAIMSADHIYCMAPGKTKAEAVYRTVNGQVSEECPASILRNHQNAQLFLDTDSAAKI